MSGQTALKHVAGGTTTIDAVSTTEAITATLPAKSGTVAMTNDVIGVNQTWQDAKNNDVDGQGLRVYGVTYTNNTGKPIYVSVSGLNKTVPGGLTQEFIIDGVSVNTNGSANNGLASDNYAIGQTMVVPDGSTYQVVAPSLTLFTWKELR